MRMPVSGFRFSVFSEGTASSGIIGGGTQNLKPGT
jgi:hypothetical protein